MSRRQVCAELQAVRVLVAGGLERLERENAPGDAPYWVESARLRLHGLDGVLVSAAGGISAWSRALVGAVIVFPLVWGTAAGARAIGFGSAWVIVTAVVVLVAATLPIAALTQRLSAAVDRRRMRRATARPRANPVSEKDEVIDVLLRARVRLVSSALRQVPSRYWRVAHLAGLATNDTSVNRISHADLLLCQAIDFLEIGAAQDEAQDEPLDGARDACHDEARRAG